MVVNPTRTQLAEADYEFMIAATEKNLMMVEGEAKECSEEDLVEGIADSPRCYSHTYKGTAGIKGKSGVTGKREYTKPERNEEIKQ